MLGSQARPPSPPSPLLPASSSSWHLSSGGWACTGASPQLQQVQASTLPALGAAEELTRHFPGWPDPGGAGHGGQRRPSRGLGGVGRAAEGLTCHTRSRTRRNSVAGGGGAVSEAHSTLIHKVGNTTPSSAVSSAFYFMGGCTVCLSVGRYSSGRPLLLLTPASRAPSPPRGSLRPLRPARGPEGPPWAPWAVTQHGARPGLLSLPPPTSSLVPSSLPYPHPPGSTPSPHFRRRSGRDHGYSGGLTLVPSSDPLGDPLPAIPTLPSRVRPQAWGPSLLRSPGPYSLTPHPGVSPARSPRLS